jgi:hypothetical protein
MWLMCSKWNRSHVYNVNDYVQSEGKYTLIWKYENMNDKYTLIGEYEW